jgi:subtilisin family serine protease
MIVSLMLSLVPYSLMAQGPVSRGEMVAVDRATARPLPELLPQEVLDFFGDGLTADEFVARTGYVPRALDGLVDRDVLVIIQLEQQPAALAYAEAKASGEPMAQGSLDSYRRGLEVAQTQVMAQATALGAREISRYDTVYNGIQASVPANRLAEVAALPGVVSVRRAPIHTPSLSENASLPGAAEVSTMLGLLGEGIVIGIIDTGIDYTHAAFGGSGNPADYAGNDPNVREPDSFPTWKVIGGYDFAGTNYNASSLDPIIYTPQPDNDPLDEHGHGTHVAAIAAGVPLIGSALQSSVAPAAGLIAYKVFGKSGSTSLTMDALEMATENYLVFGYPDVINMSLGSPFGAADPLDPDVAATDAASAAGIVVVASAGNEGNVSYITGSPGVASTAISVAATTSGYLTGPTVSVPGSADPNLADIVYQPPAFSATGQFQSTITGTLAVYSTTDPKSTLFCNQDATHPAPPPAGSLAGKIALIQRGDCTYTVKFANAAAAGAIAGLVYNNSGNERVTMAGDSTIPGGFLARQDGLDLLPFNDQPVQVSAVDDVIYIPDPYTPAGRLASFSSRGPRGYDSFLKPEVAAPGVGIYSAKMGSGAGGVSMSGTSMAAPYVAGLAALVREVHPDWTPEMVKAAIMNTAVDMADGSTLPRAGAGPVDPLAAVLTELVAIGDEDLVSVNWGAVYSKDMTETLTAQVTLVNASDRPITGTATTALQPGSLSAGVLETTVTPAIFAVDAGESAVFEVTVTLSVPDLVYGASPLEAYFGYVSFTPLALAPSGEMPGPVRVPFFFTPQPYAALDITGDDTIVNPRTGMALLGVTHSGSIASDMWLYPALVAPEAPNPAVAPNASVRMLGMDYAGLSGYGDIIAVAIDAWAPWHVPQPYFSEFDLYVDANADGVWDYVNFNFNSGWAGGGTSNNTWMVIQVELATGIMYYASPYPIYADYNSSLMEWYLPAAWQDLGSTNSDFAYQLVGWDQYGASDETPAGRFDYLRAPLIFGVDSPSTLQLGPADRTGLIGIWVGELASYRLAKPLGLMVVDYAGNPNNDDGARSYLAPLHLVYTYQYWFPFMVQGALVP